MTPAEQAAAVYQREPCARTFREDMDAHLLNPAAVIVSCSSAFLMARPVCRAWDQHAITDPWFNSLTCAPDCWHIYLAAGDLSAFFTFPHQPLAWVSFERGNRLRFHSYDTLRRRCTTTRISTVPTSIPG